MKGRSGYVYFDEREKCWYARATVTDDNGKRRNLKKRGASKSEAETKLKLLVRQIDDEGSKVADFNQLTFTDLADFYEKRYLHEAIYVDGRKISGLRDTARPTEFLNHFREYFGKAKLRNIAHSDLCLYRDERFKVHTQYKRQRTIASWNREAAVLRRIFNIALQQGWILKNPFHCGDALIITSAERRRDKILTVAEEQRLLDACDSHPYRKHLKPLLIFLVDTGCRKSEALKLRWRSVCFVSRIITIEGMTTKTLKARQVMMTERVFRELSNLRQASDGQETDTVFKVSDNVRRSFASACEVAGIRHGGVDGLTLHSLRHTAATRLVKGGMNLQLAGRILGHNQVNTTYRYLSADSETLAQAARVFEEYQAEAYEPAQASEVVN